MGLCARSCEPNHPSHTSQTDFKPTKYHQIRGEIDFVGLGSVYDKIYRGEIIQTCLKDLSPANCRLCIDYMSVRCRLLSGSFRGCIGLTLIMDGTQSICLRKVIYRVFVGQPYTIWKQLQDRIKLNITPNCVESRPTSARHIPNPKRMQTDNRLSSNTYIEEPTKMPANMSSQKWCHKVTLPVAHFPQLIQIITLVRYPISTSLRVFNVHLELVQFKTLRPTIWSAFCRRHCWALM